MARPQHAPTGTTRLQVSIAAANGMANADIALAIGVSRGTLEKHYRYELTAGAARRKLELLQSAHMAAMHGNVSAQRLLLDLQARTAPLPGEEENVAPKRASRLGKKAQAKQDAIKAEAGTGWDQLLPTGVLPFRQRA